MTTPFDIVTELYLAGAWADISTDVYGDRDMEIVRGSSDWSSTVQPGRCTTKFKNKTGKFSPHNPAGPYYGNLARNIPLRVTVNGYRRFLGEVSEWPLRAEPIEYVDIEAAGVLRRLAQCESEEQSALRRGLSRPIEPGRKPAAYWACENIDDGQPIHPAEGTMGAALVVNESESGLSSRSGFLGSAPIVTLNDSRIYGDIPSYGVNSTPVTAGALIRLPDNGVAANDTRIMTANTAGTAAYWRVRANTDGTLNIQVADPTTDGGGGGTITTTANTSWSLSGRNAFLALVLEESSGNVTWNLLAWIEGGTAPLLATGNVASRSYLRINRLTFGSNFNAGATSIGHIGVWPKSVDLDLSAYLQQLVNGWRGETAAARVERIAQEEGIALAPQGSTSDSLPMVQQGVKSGLDLLTEAAEADGGVLYEPPDFPTRVIADGETSVGGFISAGGPTLVTSTTQAHSGARSVRVTWGAASNIVMQTQDYFIPGCSYTYSAWVYVPAGNPAVKLRVEGVADSGPSTVTNTWQQLSVSWTATTYTYSIRLVPSTTASAGTLCYFDDLTVTANRAGLHFTPLRSLYNQTPALTVDYDAAEIAFPFEPTDDDRYLNNDVSVSVDGAPNPARYTLTSGPLSINPPPNGAGRYASSVTRNVLSGTLAYHWAGWLVHLGTWNEPRFPTLTVNLNRKRALIPSAAAVVPGSVVAGTNMPSWLPPQDLKQIVAGMTENLNVRTWKLTFNCAPARPYDVFVLDTSVLSTDSTLAATTTAPAPGTSMTISVTSTAAGGRWATSGIFPVSIMIAPKEGMIGELMTVTGISGTGLTQTFTVTRGVNGFTKAWPSGSAVFLAQRPTLAL